MIVTFLIVYPGNLVIHAHAGNKRVLIYQEGMWLPLTDEQRLVILKAYGIEMRQTGT